MFRDLISRLNTRDTMALELSTALIALTFVLAFRAPDSDAFKILLGGLLTTGFTTAVGFYFNSSKGSEAHSAALETTATKQAEIIDKQSAALAVSAPAAPVTVTTETKAPDSTTTTTTAPAELPVQPPPAKV